MARVTGEWERREAAARDLTATAWLTAALIRQETLPSLDVLLGREETKEDTAQRLADEQAAMSELLAGAADWPAGAIRPDVGPPVPREVT